MSEEKDRWWCREGCGFVENGHRCEQWCHLSHIPAAAIRKIKEEVKK